MKILIVTDAWFPQVNGVVTTLSTTEKELTDLGHDVVILHPGYEGLKTFPLPSYPEIRMPWNVWRVGKIIKKIRPDAIHIATEGTLGLAARTFCYRKRIPITSSYHTKYPEYIKERLPFIPLSWGYKFMRWVHRDSRAVLVTTETMKKELDAWSLNPNLVIWSRGVDADTFNPAERTRTKIDIDGIPRLVYVGRVSVEKNIEAFLNIDDMLGDKVVVGDGPQRKELEKNYPNVKWLGYKKGKELAKEYANADVFVFPSLTDTFGLVMIEANACGTPVAAYPVAGPIDIVVEGINGSLDKDLEAAVTSALKIDREGVRTHTVDTYSWAKSTHIFFSKLVPITNRWS